MRCFTEVQKLCKLGFFLFIIVSQCSSLCRSEYEYYMQVVLTIMVTLGAPIFGIPALVLAIKAVRYHKCHQWTRASTFARYSLMLCTAGLVVCILVIIVYMYVVHLSPANKLAANFKQQLEDGAKFGQLLVNNEAGIKLDRNVKANAAHFETVIEFMDKK